MASNVPAPKRQFSLFCVAKSPIIASLAVGWVLLWAGCTFDWETPKLVRYESAPPPPRLPQILTLGKIEFTDASVTTSNAVRLKAAFAKGVKQAATETNLIHFGVHQTHLPLGTDCLILSGTVTGMKKGGGGAALLLGLVAERWGISGSFEVRNGTGRLLTEITGQYALKTEGLVLGVGVGGPDYSDWEYMATRLGSGVGDEISQWLKNQKKPLGAH